MTKQVNEDSAAQATLRPQNKSEMISKAILAMSGMSIEDLSKFHNEVIAQVGHEADGVGNVSGSNQSSLNMHPSAASSAMKEAVADDLALVFGEGEDLSEELKSNVSTIFESALEARIAVERESLVEEFNTNLDEAYNQLAEEMSTQLDAYLDDVVESWLTENEVAIESALRNELVEDFLTGLRNLFSEHYIDVPEDKVDVVEELASRVEDLEARLDTTLIENASLKTAVQEVKKIDVVNMACEGLALTSAEKLRGLVETVEFNGDLDDYTNKVNVLKESVVNKVSVSDTPAKTGLIAEESDPNASGAEQKVVSPDVQRYMSAIARSARGR